MNNVTTKGVREKLFKIRKKCSKDDGTEKFQEFVNFKLLVYTPIKGYILQIGNINSLEKVGVFSLVTADCDPRSISLLLLILPGMT